MPFLNPDRRPIIRHPEGHEVDVITSHKATGELKPLYFHIEDDQQERFTFKLSYVYLYKSHNYIETYACEYFAYGRVNPILLFFDVTQKRWTIG